MAGDTIQLKLPGADVDPDGDAVTMLGVSAAPLLGRVVKYGANSIEYQAYPGSAGTDEFSYLITDSAGGVATGSVRVASYPLDRRSHRWRSPTASPSNPGVRRAPTCWPTTWSRPETGSGSGCSTLRPA